ncbi:MAG: 4-hydroxy-tetrahydrodipicolinate reductase [Neisseriaceae bacterium]
MAGFIISGAKGKMGQALLEAVSQEPGVSLAGALVRTAKFEASTNLPDSSPSVDLPQGVTVSDSLETLLQKTSASVLIDFTRPEATLEYLPICMKCHLPMVIGTTGFSAQEKIKIHHASQVIPIVFSPNFSVGVNLTFALVALAARTLAAEYDVEVIEAHHRHKVDAPSGTSLRLGEIIAEQRYSKLQELAVFCRHGNIGSRKLGSIGFSAIRAADIVGEHTVLFATEGERLEITHKASSRRAFAQGAIQAALWLQARPPGLYSMQEVLGTESI